MTATPPSPDFEAIKQRQQKTWASGNYALVGTRLQIVSELLCEAVDLRAGQKVDVATGSGNAALAAARRFCIAIGIDYVPALLEDARRRAVSEGLSADFQEGDAENLAFPDGSFDAVLSVVGAMFAPNQEKVAAELLRVTRPGGKIGMVNWTPDGFIGEIFKLNGGYVPSPPGVKPPTLWGTETRLRELFGDQIASLTVTKRSFVFRYLSPQHYVDYHRAYYGPTLRAFESLTPEQQESLAREQAELVQRFNRADDGTAVWNSDYLEVVAVKH
jgi:ubiquinone/menaquinone biosynthesis C-methylase UbiE